MIGYGWLYYSPYLVENVCLSFSTHLITINIMSVHMTAQKNEIDKLIDNMIIGGDELVNNLKTVLPDALSESMVMFQESNVANLKKIKEFLNKQHW